MQLSSLQKACEDLKTENEALKSRVAQQQTNLSTALQEQQQAFQGQVDSLQAQLHQE